MVMARTMVSQPGHVPWDLKRKIIFFILFSNLFSCEKRTCINIRKGVIFFIVAEKYRERHSARKVDNSACF